MRFLFGMKLRPKAPAVLPSEIAPGSALDTLPSP
jgi:hypothetical protein